MSAIPISQLQCPVELFISCQGLKNTDLIGKSDPRVRVFMQQEDKKWHRIGSTEKIKNNLNPEFRTTIITDFVFEARQPLKFEVTDIDESSITDDYIGVAETTLGEIIAAPRQTMHLAVRSRSRDIVGTLIVRGDKNGQARNTIFFQWSGINLINFGGCFSKKTCPFLRFFKQKDREWFQVYATEVVQENMNPFWQMFKTTDDKLCGGAHNKPVKIECWDHREDGKHKFIGATEITVEKLRNGENLFQLANPTKIKGTGSLKLVSFTMDPRPSFFDFIRGGEQLNSIVGIDYTASNNDELRKVNLHARLPDGQFNEYQQAIIQICEIIENYDRRKMIPVFGFGAIPKYENLSDWKVSHCFPCSGDVEKSQAQGISGVLDVYRYALDNVKLAGPTNFAPIITEAMKVCQIHKKDDTDIYTTFLIITDGLIGDMNETINALMEAAYLPISIIIIGLGTADFSKMEILDGDKAIVNKAGEKCAREFVKFVPFGRFKNNMQELARHVLARIPEQLVEYKLLVGKKPKPVFYECSSNS